MYIWYAGTVCVHVCVCCGFVYICVYTTLLILDSYLHNPCVRVIINRTR